MCARPIRIPNRPLSLILHLGNGLVACKGEGSSFAHGVSLAWNQSITYSRPHTPIRTVQLESADSPMDKQSFSLSISLSHTHPHTQMEIRVGSEAEGRRVIVHPGSRFHQEILPQALAREHPVSDLVGSRSVALSFLSYGRMGGLPSTFVPNQPRASRFLRDPRIDRPPQSCVRDSTATSTLLGYIPKGSCTVVDSP